MMTTNHAYTSSACPHCNGNGDVRWHRKELDHGVWAWCRNCGLIINFRAQGRMNKMQLIEYYKQNVNHNWTLEDIQLLIELKSQDMSDKEIIIKVEAVRIERIMSTERAPLPKVTEMKEKNRWKNWYNHQVADIRQQS